MGKEINNQHHIVTETASDRAWSEGAKEKVREKRKEEREIEGEEE